MKKKESQFQAATLSELFRQLKHKRVAVRIKALELLATIDRPPVVGQIIEALSDRSPSVRGVAAESLGLLRKKEAILPLIDKLEDSDSEVRMLAASSLGDLLQGGRTPPALIRKLQDSDELVRLQTAESLGAIGDKRVLSALWKGLGDRSTLVRSYVAGAIGELGSKNDIPKLVNRLSKEKSETSQVGYYQALYALGKHDVVKDLLQMLSDSKDYRVRSAVSKVLADIGHDQNRAVEIKAALQMALKQETALAVKSSIRSGIRDIDKFLKQPGSTVGKSK